MINNPLTVMTCFKTFFNDKIIPETKDKSISMNNISLDIIKLFEILKFNVSKIASVSSLWKK